MILFVALILFLLISKSLQTLQGFGRNESIGLPLCQTFRSMASRYTYTPDSLIGSNGEVSPINCIYAASKMLKGKGLTSQSINKAMDALKGLAESTGMNGMEPLVFVPVFERELTETSTGVIDLANYFNCPVLDVMMYYSSLSDLEQKGFLTFGGSLSKPLIKRKYRVHINVLEAILQGKLVKQALSPVDRKPMDQFDFCHIVSEMADNREREGMDTRQLLANIMQLEETFSRFDLVKTMREKGVSIENRAVFYLICDDFSFASDHETDLSEVLDAIFDARGERLAVRSSILLLENQLIKEGWLEGVGENGVKLTNQGLTLFLDEMAKTYLKPIDGLDCYAFASTVNKIYRDADEDRPGFSNEMGNKLFRLEIANERHLPFVNKLIMDFDTLDRFLFYMVCYKCMEDDTFDIGNLSCIYPKAQSIRMSHMLKAQEHPLQKGKLVECSKQGFFDKSVLSLTDDGKRLFFGDDARNFMEKIGDRDFFTPEKIVERRLYFNEQIQTQLDLLQRSLEEEHFQTLRKHLEERGMQKGIAVLLYGPPGTGKTESVMQIARATGRAIYHVDISATKSCWFGESEKLIKDVFKRYEDICEHSEKRPILLFNEADGIFSKRKDSDSSNVAQTENTIQNIILEEMERLDGILIATTNMADNLDGAFERRFLFKIKYDKPTLEARKSIWLSKMPTLKADDAQALADAFAFSGGEIDNIVRKSTIMEVLNATEPNLQELKQLCKEEKMHGDTVKIGFS